MRKIVYSILVASAAMLSFTCCISCNQNDDPQQEEEKKPVDPTEKTELQAGTYTFTASALKGEWKEGDQIYIHGSYGPAAKTITLSASQINGNVASVELSCDILEFPVKPDGLYAAYPGQAVLENDSLMDHSTEFVSGLDGIICAAYLDGTNFVFMDATSGISFKVSGGYTNYAIAGNKRPGLRNISYTVEVENGYSDFTSRKSDGYPFLEGVINNGDGILLFPGNITISGGYTIYLGKNGEWPMTYTVSEDVKLKAGTIIDLGDITSSLTPYDGPAPKMPEMGARTKYSVKLNELSGLCLSADGSFLWSVGDGGELAKLSFSGEVLEHRSISGDTEAVTLDYDTGDLLIGMEPNGVGKIAGPNHDGKLQSLFKIAAAKNFGNAGLEGLTYYKDGLVYAGAQTNSDLFLCNLETGEVIWQKHLREIFPAITEIADLFYDKLTDWLWIIDSESRKVFALTGDAEFLMGAYSVRGIENPESVCVDHIRQCIWVGDDYGSTSYLYRFDFTGLDDALLN